jgi:hypothetical protein
VHVNTTQVVPKKSKVAPIAVLGERLYCSKATTVGPDASQTIASRMLSFGP